MAETGKIGCVIDEDYIQARPTGGIHTQGFVQDLEVELIITIEDTISGRTKLDRTLQHVLKR